MLSENAERMKWRLEDFPGVERLQALAGEIRAVQQRSFDRYIEEHVFPSRRTGTRVRTSTIADPTAHLAIYGRERFDLQKQRDLKRLVTAYQKDKRFRRLALDCIAHLPDCEKSLITRHCLSGEAITMIAHEIGLSRATGYRRYDEAIERFTDLYRQAARHESAIAG